MSDCHSMTGFGEGRAEDVRVRISVAIRTVNHRFVDLQLRLPDAYRPFEIELAKAIRKRLSRGRIEARYRIDPLVEPPLNVRIRREVAASYRRAALELAGGEEEGRASSEAATTSLSAVELLRLPEVVVVEAAEVEPDETDRDLLLRATGAALDAVIVSRRREGEHLRGVLSERLERLRALRDELEAGAEGVQRALAQTLARRLEELLGESGIDPARLAQEAAVLADRADVREELDRLAGHLDAFAILLDSDGPRGKRLDFLTQEILRELNTLGSKCRETRQLERVVEAKTVCEQLKEQVQNLE